MTLYGGVLGISLSFASGGYVGWRTPNDLRIQSDKFEVQPEYTLVLLFTGIILGDVNDTLGRH
jgi:hypothetical protein